MFAIAFLLRIASGERPHAIYSAVSTVIKGNNFAEAQLRQARAVI
jgi:hypothetical protein